MSTNPTMTLISIMIMLVLVYAWCMRVCEGIVSFNYMPSDPTDAEKSMYILVWRFLIKKKMWLHVFIRSVKLLHILLQHRSYIKESKYEGLSSCFQMSYSNLKSNFTKHIHLNPHTSYCLVRYKLFNHTNKGKQFQYCQKLWAIEVRPWSVVNKR